VEGSMLSERLKNVILRELTLEQIDVDETTTANEIPGWDSLAHIRILAAVENEFGIRFKSLEVLRLQTIMDLQRLVDSKLKR
jgi:acyl carrier protein